MVQIKKTTLSIAQTAIIASVYAASTMLLGPFGYSWIQIRIGEALTPLPLILGSPAVAGLTIGCIIANLVSPVGIPDMIFGPALTFAAAICSWKLCFRKPFLACLYPVIINAIGVSAYLSSFYGVPYFVTVITVGIGEFIAAFVVGYPTLLTIRKLSRKA